MDIVERRAREIFSVVSGTEYAGMFHPAYEGNEQFWRIVAEASGVSELVEALEVFENAADECDEYGEEDNFQAPVTAGECRKARQALARYRGEA